MENQILAVMVNFFKMAGLITDTCALCFDGVMIYKNGQHKPKFDILLPACSDAIKKALGIDTRARGEADARRLGTAGRY